MRLGHDALVVDTPEVTAGYQTVVAWWDVIEVLVVTGAATAKVEAANTGIKQIKRTVRGFRNPHNYRTRILLTSASKTAA